MSAANLFAAVSCWVTPRYRERYPNRLAMDACEIWRADGYLTSHYHRKCVGQMQLAMHLSDPAPGAAYSEASNVLYSA